ncbi:MAG: hypothetical protein WA231_05790 [Methylocella sp.]
MLDEACDGNFVLNEAEVETLRRAASERNIPYDSKRTTFSKSELAKFGMVREAYTTEELRTAGFGPDPVTSFDERQRPQKSFSRLILLSVVAFRNGNYLSI